MMLSIEPGDTRLLPVYLSALSGVFVLWAYSTTTITSTSKNSVQWDAVAFALRVARLACVLALLGISAFDVAAHQSALAGAVLASYVSGPIGCVVRVSEVLL